MSDLDRLAADLGRAPRRAAPEVVRVLKKGAQNVKDDTRRNISGHPSWSRLEHTVGYDMSRLPGPAGMRADVGYDDVGQGELAGIYEFGSSRRSGRPTLIPAFERERPRLEDELGKVAERIVAGLL